MQQTLSLFVIIAVNQVTISKPINNGFTLKFKPISLKSEVKPKSFGALFVKIPQDSTYADNQQENISKAYFSQSSEIGSGCTNQISKILFPFKSADENNSFENANYLNIPIIQQRFEDYKIVVATAPSDVRISGPEAKPVVVYIVFQENDTDSKAMNIPSIYFVTKSSALPDLKTKDKVDPIMIIDSNRTVTGLKSKEVPKFVKFKNKLTERYNYEVERR